MTKLVFSFDDGRKDNLRTAFEILERNNIPASFNITTDFVSSLLRDDELPCKNEALSKDEVIKLGSKEMFEIAGHGKKHSNECQNLISGIAELREWFPNKIISGIASPYSQAKIEDLITDKNVYLNNGISYIRLGDRITSFVIVKKIFRKLNCKLFHIPFIYAWVYEECFIEQNGNFILYSVPVLKMDTVGEVLALIKHAVKKDKNLILMFHSVLQKGEPEYNSKWSWDWNKFEKLISTVNEMQKYNLLQVVTTQNLMTGK